MSRRAITVLLAACFIFPATALQAQTPLGYARNDPPQLQVALAKVNLYLQSGRMDEASALIRQLKAQYPSNTKVLAAEADLNLLDGNRGAAFAALNRASMLEPNNQDIANRQRAALLDEGPLAAGGYQVRHTNQANEQIFHATAQAPLSPSMSAQINVDDDHLHSRQPFLTVHGDVRNYDDDRQRGNITIGKVLKSGDEANVTGYAGNRSLGGGAAYSMWDRGGATTLEGNFRKPYWDYPETVIAEATKDNLRLERKQIISNHLVIVLDGGFNRYSMQDLNNAASAAAWNLNVTYTHPYSFTGKPEDNIVLGASYRANAEYFTHLQRLTDTLGDSFKPFPSNSYEVHSALVSASRNLVKDVYGELYGGYAVDRLGSNGPLFGGMLEYAVTQKVALELSASRNILGGLGNSEKQDLLNLNLKWRW